MIVDQIKNVVDAVEGIVNAERVLEDGLHVAPVGLQLLVGHIGDIFAFKDDLARCELDKAEHEVRQRGFAAAALAGYGGNGGWRFINGQIEIVKRDD